MVYNASALVRFRSLANSHTSSLLQAHWPFGPAFLPVSFCYRVFAQVAFLSLEIPSTGNSLFILQLPASTSSGRCSLIDPFVNLNPALENPLHIAAVRRCESKAFRRPSGGLPAGSPASPGGPSFVQEPAAVAAPCPPLGESGSLSSLRWGSVLLLPFLPLLFFHPDF